MPFNERIHETRITNLFYSSYFQLLLTTSYNNTIELTRFIPKFQDFIKESALPHGSQVSSFALHNQNLISIDLGYQLRVWDLVSKTVIQSFFIEIKHPYHQITCLP